MPYHSTHKLRTWAFRRIITANLLSPKKAISRHQFSSDAGYRLFYRVVYGMVQSNKCSSFSLSAQPVVSSLEEGYSHNVPYAPTVFLGKRKVSFTLMDYQAVLSAKQIITDHPKQDLTIHSLSKEVFLNEQKLKLCFFLCYGISIGAYLKSCRMIKASELLVHTDFSIEEVAHAFGYTSSASFIKAFRQKYETTSLQFRTDVRLRTATRHIAE